MARTVTDEQIKLSIIVNGDPAQKQLLQLEESTRKLTQENKELEIRKKQLIATGKTQSKEYKELTATIKANSQTIANNKATMKELQNQIGITGLTMTQLRQKATILRATLSNMVPGSADFKRYQNELNQVNARISELSGRAKTAQSSLGTLADKFNRYQGIALSAIAATTGLVLSVQKIIDINGKLSDSQSDVMKTTGMTKSEVDELTKSFGLLKTRTARTELLELATEAGRLGITGVENVRAFTEEANKLKVALGDDLSSEQIREVGKMAMVYKVGEQTGKDFAGSMDALGSAINEVAASGANQAGFLVDYLKRQAGVAATVGLSADANVAYAASFDQLGQSAEVSATAMNKIWMDMAKKPQNFAKVVGVSVGEFKQIMEKDANQAMMMFLNALNANKVGASTLLDSLKDIEAGGSRGDSAIMALAKNIGVLTNYQNISSQALMEATSLTDEYNLKNNNLQATIEKVKKTMMGWFSSETIVGGLSTFFLWFAKLIGATEDLDGSVTRFKDRLIVFLKVLTIIIASYISYSAALKLTALWTKTVAAAQAIHNMIQTKGAVATNLLRGAQLLLASAYNLVTGNTARATAAMRLFNTTTKMNPLGLLLGVLAAVISAFIVFKNRATEASIASKTLADVQTTIAKNIDTEKNKLNQLVAIARDETISKERRLEAIKKLNQISPEYLGNLTLENIKTAEGIKLINAYITQLEKKATVEAFSNKRSELMTNKLNALMDAEKNRTLALQKGSTSFKELYEAEQKLLQQMTKDERKLWNAKNLDVESTKKKSDAIAKAMSVLTDEEKQRIEVLKGMSSWTKDSYIDYRKSIGEAVIGLKALNEEEKKFMQNNVGLYTENNNNETQTGAGLSTPTTTPTATTKEKYDDSYLENERRLREELRKLQQKTDDEYFKTLEDNYNKEVNLQKTKHKNLVDDLTAEVEAKQFLIDKIDQDIAAASKAGDNKKVNSLKAQKQIIIDMQGEINKQIEFQEAIHKNELSKIQSDYQKKVIQGIDELYKDERELRAMKHEAEMANVNLSNRDRQRIQREFERQELDEERKYLETKLQTLTNIMSGIEVDGINFDLLPPDVRKKLEYDIEYLKNAIGALSAAKKDLENPKEQDLGLGGQTDILGYSQDQWEKFFENIQAGTIGIQTMSMAVGAMQNMWGEYDKLITAQENRQLQNYQRHNDGRKRMLQRQLDTGAITQEQYNKRVQQLDEETDQKKFEIELQQAKRQRAMALVNIAVNTAQAIMRIWADVPKFDFGSSSFILSALVAATGAMQAGAVMSQPLPTRGYEEGFYPVLRQQDKKPFSAQFGGNIQTGFYNKPTILVGEGAGSMPEMIIDKQAFAQISPETKQALISELRLIKGFEKGLYSQLAQNNIAPPPASQSNSNELIMAMMALISENTAVLKDLRDGGVIGKFYDKDMESFRALEKGMKDYNELTNKAKR